MLIRWTEAEEAQADAEAAAVASGMKNAETEKAT